MLPDGNVWSFCLPLVPSVVRTHCSFWAVGRLKASRPGLGCGHTGGTAIASFNGHSAKDRAHGRPDRAGRARPSERPGAGAVELLRQRPVLLRAVHQPEPAGCDRTPLRVAVTQLQRRHQGDQLPRRYRLARHRGGLECLHIQSRSRRHAARPGRDHLHHQRHQPGGNDLPHQRDDQRRQRPDGDRARTDPVGHGRELGADGHRLRPRRTAAQQRRATATSTHCSA